MSSRMVVLAMDKLMTACRLLIAAYRKSNMVDFWRAVALIEQALIRVEQAEAERIAREIQTQGD